MHPAVVESAVVASPDPQRDEVVKAFVVLTESANKEQDKEGAQEEAARFLQRKCSSVQVSTENRFCGCQFLAEDYQRQDQES